MIQTPSDSKGSVYHTFIAQDFTAMGSYSLNDAHPMASDAAGNRSAKLFIVQVQFKFSSPNASIHGIMR